MRVLVVEDDPGVGELVCDDLRAQRHAVDWAQDGQQAASLIASFPYDLVVLDLMLPGLGNLELGGLEVTAQVRAQRNPVPILMLTALGSLDDRVRGLEAGADDYLVKPFHLRELRARVQALLRRAGGEASNRVTVGRCDLDLGQSRAWFAGAELRLSGTEYALLAFLMLHAQRYTDRNELVEHVWPGDASIDPRTVDSYVLYLRRKLSQDAIETRRGLGYRLRG